MTISTFPPLVKCRDQWCEVCPSPGASRYYQRSAPVPGRSDVESRTVQQDLDALECGDCCARPRAHLDTTNGVRPSPGGAATRKAGRCRRIWTRWSAEIAAPVPGRISILPPECARPRAHL